MPRTATAEQVADFWRARANRLHWALIDIATRAGGDPEERARVALAYEREHDGGPDPVETARAELQGARDALDAALQAGEEAHDEIARERREAFAGMWLAVGYCALVDILIADRDRVLDALPCPAHGRCVPHALEEIARLRGAVPVL